MTTAGWGCQLLDGLFIGRGLHVMGMNAAKESLCHCLHLIFTPLTAVETYPAAPSGKWQNRRTLDILSHIEQYSTPQIKKCPDCEHGFSRKFVVFLTIFCRLSEPPPPCFAVFMNSAHFCAYRVPSGGFFPFSRLYCLFRGNMLPLGFISLFSLPPPAAWLPARNTEVFSWLSY